MASKGHNHTHERIYFDESYDTLGNTLVVGDRVAFIEYNSKDYTLREGVVSALYERQEQPPVEVIELDVKVGKIKRRIERADRVVRLHT
jgi:hypothetical protein